MGYLDKYHVHLPNGEVDGLRIEHFEITKNDIGNLIAGFKPGRRQTRPGVYTRLVDRGKIWMTDTDAEVLDHLEPMYRVEDVNVERVLINGLGLGMVLKHVLAQPHVKHVDVVELDPRVIKLVGPHYADSRLTIHEADAYTITWPTGMRWNLAWHDIWSDICTDNLPLMAKLHRRYGRRVDWQGSWGKELTQRYRELGY